MRALEPAGPFLVIVTAADDPVVPASAARDLVSALQPRAHCNSEDPSALPVCVLETAVGGHMSMSIVSKALARQFLEVCFKQ